MRFPDVSVLGHAEVPTVGRFVLLMVREDWEPMAAREPAPNIPECTCDRDDDSWVGEPVDMPLCPYHEQRLRHLSWESLACLVIDYEAVIDYESVLAARGARPLDVERLAEAIERACADHNEDCWFRSSPEIGAAAIAREFGKQPDDLTRAGT